MWLGRLHKDLQVMGTVVTHAMVERSHKGFAGHLWNLQCWVLVMEDDLKPICAGIMAHKHPLSFSVVVLLSLVVSCCHLRGV